MNSESTAGLSMLITTMTGFPVATNDSISFQIILVVATQVGKRTLMRFLEEVTAALMRDVGSIYFDQQNIGLVWFGNHVSVPSKGLPYLRVR